MSATTVRPQPRQQLRLHQLHRHQLHRHQLLGLAALGEADPVLRRPGAQIADIGCGEGWSSLELARTYPAASIEGWDVDEDAIEVARRHAYGSGLEDRVVFSCADRAWSRLRPAWYDAAVALDHVAHLPSPVDLLAAMRRSVRPGGIVIIGDDMSAPAKILRDYVSRAGFTHVNVLTAGERGRWRFYRLAG